MKRSTMRVFWATILFYAFLLFIPDKVVALSVSVLFLGVLTVILKDVSSVFLIGYLVFVPLPLGKFFPIDLVSAADLHFLLGRPFGISADILVTPREGLVVGMALLLLLQAIRDKRMFWPEDFLGWMLLYLPITMGIATYMGSIIPGVSVLHALFYLEPFIIYTFFRSISHRPDYRLVVLVVSAALLFESAVTLAQFAKGSPLGLVVEAYPEYTPVDVSTDGASLLRLGGTFLHANVLAHYVIFSLLLILPVFFASGVSHPLMFVLPMFLGFTALMLTQSRTAWVALGVGTLTFVLMARRLGLAFAVSPLLRRVIWMIAVSAGIVASVLAIPRLIETTHTFEPYGSGVTRVLLIRESLEVIRQHPWFGVGLAMDVYALYRRAQSLSIPLVSYFPEPVHNGFMQILMSTGIVGFLPYLLVLGAMFRLFWRAIRHSSTRKKYYLVGVLSGLVAWVINANFQPLLFDIGVLALLIAILT